MPFEIVRNDITKMRVDAIVNAANNSLMGGGGVDGAIHRAAGPKLLEECRALNGCPTGEAKITRGYDLPCRYIIHTVGPIWQGGGAGERALLAACYRHSLALAKANDCESVAFPLISSGAYGYPKGEALRVAVDEIARFLREEDMRVYLVVFTRDAVQPGGKLYSDIAAYIDDVYVSGQAEYNREARRSQYMGDAAPDQSGAGGGLFRRKHREDNARNETVFSEASLHRLTAMQPEAMEDVFNRTDESFYEMLFRKIAERGLTDAAFCRRANIDRRQFDRIFNNPACRPGKSAVLAFAIALALPLEEAKELLMKAGYALSHGSKTDIAAEYCLVTGNCDLIEINQVLFRMDLQPLGC